MINENLYNPEIWRAYKERFNPGEEYLGRNKVVNKLDPLVSVCVPTYNHEHFIGQCLDSILNQKTNFIFEILIGEDGSQDNTRFIVKEYAANHPDKIRLFLRDRTTSHFYDKNGKNVFNLNHKWLRKSARGKYIAWCDGDDFWIDNKKIEKQVHFLELNVDYSLCFHNAKVIQSSNSRTHKFSNIKEGEYTGIDIYNKWLIPTSSALFRTEYVRNSRHVFNKNFVFGDIILFLTLAERGRLWFMDKTMSVYRRHEGGAVHQFLNDPENIRNTIIHHKEIIKTFPEKYKKAGHKNLNWLYFLLFKATFKINFFYSLSSLMKSFYYSGRNASFLLIKLMKTKLKG